MRFSHLTFLLFLSLVSANWYQACAPGVCSPQSVHLALAGNPTTMNVGWFTLYESLTSTVRYGLQPTSLTQRAEGTQSSYLKSNFDDVTFFQHFTTLTGLSPSTTYYYQCGDEEGGWSNVFNFTTAPEDGSSESFTVGVYGDMGIANAQYTQSRLIHKTLSGEIDWIFHIGDIGYADDYNDGMYEAVWDQWFRSVEPITSTIPYMVTPGNHEYACYAPSSCKYATNFTVYLNRFQMPYKSSGAINNMWYSFNYGRVHFVAIDTETDFPGAPEGSTMFGDQLSWLQKDLETARQNPNITWIIVGGHRPIYSSSCDYSIGRFPLGDTARLQDAFEDLFYQYNVDIYVCGHVHSYERDYPIYKNNPVINSNSTSDVYYNPQATVYIVSGAPGNTEGFASCWNDIQPDWSAFRLTHRRGYGIFTIDQNSLKWDFIASDDNSIIDTFTITK